MTTTDDNDDVFKRLDTALMNDSEFEAISSHLRNSRPNPSVQSVLENSAEYARIRKAAEDENFRQEIAQYKADKAKDASVIADLTKRLAERGPV